jgi:hypothetical protein
MLLHTPPENMFLAKVLVFQKLQYSFLNVFLYFGSRQRYTNTLAAEFKLIKNGPQWA